LLISAATALAQQPAPKAGPNPAEVKKLAEMLCRQLPNLSTLLTLDPHVSPDMAITDDVYTDK
jgi:hypothetical protein